MIIRVVTAAMIFRVVTVWLTNCLAILIAAVVIGPIGYGGDLGTLLLAGFILGVVNLIVRPAVIVLTLPAVILSLGLALLAINALMLWLTSRLVDGFTVGGFSSTLGGALIVWIVNAVLRRWRDHWWWRTAPTAPRSG
jgi:putative membrane protein